jgi:anti-sigma factor RsiW
MSDHLTESELAGFLDQDLPDREMARVQEHLDACHECRTELIEVGRLIDSAPDTVGTAAPPARRSRRRMPLGAAGLLAAAAIAVLILVRPDGQPAGGVPDALQRAGDQGVAELQVHGPDDGSRVPREELSFAWSSHGSASYRISVTREDGSLLWTQVVEDSVAAPPASVELPEGVALYWYVDALTGGTPARTRLHSVTVLP